MRLSLTLLLFSLSNFAFGKPQIQEPSVVHIRHSEVTIEWETDVETLSKIEFGTTKQVKQFIENKSYTEEHALNLNRLKPTTRYYFRIVSTDKNNQVTSSKLYSFRTNASDEEEDMVLTISSPPQVTHQSPQKVTISWETNIPSTGIITYGFKNQKKPKTTYSDLLTRTHIMTLESLVPNTRYFFQVHSKNSSGKTISSSYSSFLTEKRSKKEDLPKISTGPSIAFRRETEVKIEWETDRPCKSTLTWGKVPLASFQKELTASSAFKTRHTITFTDLQKGMRYYYIIYLEDPQGRKNKSEVFSIRTEKFN